MNTCGTCKYFNPKHDNDLYIPRTYALCERIEQVDSDGWKDDDERQSYQFKAVVVDGSGYFAALCVKDDFGCTEWEEK